MRFRMIFEQTLGATRSVMRLRSMLAAVALATVATTGCGSFDRNTVSMEPITGNEATPPVLASPPDAGGDASPPPTPSVPEPDRDLVCGRSSLVCHGAQLCCITDASSSSAKCVDDASQCKGADVALLACRVAADCPAGNVCCATKGANGRMSETHCATSCAATELMLCDDDAEKSGCATGLRCTSDKIDDELGLTGIYDACRPKADAGATTTTTTL